MDVLVLPVSGGAFPSQLKTLQHAAVVDCEPSVIMASSGGNVAAYVAHAANFKEMAIERVARSLHSDMFIHPWSCLPFISTGIGFLKGAIYQHGKGTNEFIRTYFTNTSITSREIWTGTYNRAQQRACFFCNKQQKDSIINGEMLDTDLYQCMKPVYMDGDIDFISHVCLASASIPATVPPQCIDGDPHVDGGVYFASPLTAMQNTIFSKAKEHCAGKLFLHYVNSIDLSRFTPNAYIPEKSYVCNVRSANMLDNGRLAASELVRGQLVSDRLVGYNLLRCYASPIHYTSFPYTPENIVKLHNFKQACTGYVLETYPEVYHELDIASFSGSDVLNLMKNAKICARLWYVGDASFA